VVVYLVNDKNEKEKITLDILRSLGDYFEDEDAIIDYSKKARDYMLFSYEEDSSCVGFILINFINDIVSEIEVMGVKPNYFRKKIGTSLFNSAYDYLKNNNYKKLIVKTVKLGVYPEYDSTNYFYKKMGFVEKEILNIWGESNPCQIYELDII